jgi:putative hydrolase of HD superfamily
MIDEIKFLIEIDKLKNIFRQTMVLNGIRQENDAEHSWHMAMSAIVLEKYHNETVDMKKVLKMALIHDIVEIYAGDTPAFGTHNPNKYNDELKSAEKIFSLLPEKLEKEMMNLWLEFELLESPEAKFAKACDTFQGFLQNITSDGHSWRKYKVKESAFCKRMEPIKLYIPQVYEEVVLPELEKYINKGVIERDIIK